MQYLKGNVLRIVNMEQRAEFLKKLNGLLALAKEQGNQITIDAVKLYFAEADLKEQQMELVFDYLLSQKVVVKGYLKVPKAELSGAEESIEGRARYSEEERIYLTEYEEDLKAFPKSDAEEEKEICRKVLQGDQRAKQRLTEIYLSKVVEIAEEMYQPGIFLGDLIQEGNLGLVLGMDMLIEDGDINKILTEQIRQSMQMFIEESSELQSRDKKMVEQVQFLDESITKLTEELGRKVTIDELSVYMGMTEDEINDILRLTGEEPGEEHDHHGHTHEEEEEA